ncbi:MAG: hypothetical protein F6K50_31405 [Moorea sp. SIO3I7]|nr:hypothetical protein [Moorena sp. SIO3I7]
MRQFLADKQYTIQCQQSYQMVNVLSLIDDLIDFNKEKEYIKESSPLTSNNPNLVLNLIQQQFSGDNSKLMANSNDQSPKINIGENAQVTTSGGGSIILGDNTAPFTNTINQLPSFDAEPDKKQLKKLLSQLQSAVREENLNDDDKEEAKEQIEDIASALTNSEDSAVKKIANKSMKTLKRIADDLPRGAAMVTICNQLPDLISKIF